MDRLELLPQTFRRERLFLLDVMADTMEADDAREVDPEALLAVTPKTLYPLVYVRLRPHAEVLGLPREVLETFAGHYRRNALMQLRRAADLRRIQSVLTSAVLPFLLLKGPVLAYTVYPDPSARTMIDLDLLVHEGDLDRAMAALTSIGYSVPAQFSGQYLNAGDAPPLVHADAGATVVELHTLLDSAPNDRETVEQLWVRAREVTLGHGLVMPTLDRGEFFAHVVTHVSRHHRFEGELRSLLDVALLMRDEADALNWLALDGEWQRRGIADWISLTVTLAHVLLGSPLPAFFRERAPSAEALRTAAELLWVTDEERPPARITHFLAGRRPTPVHAAMPRQRVSAPAGVSRAKGHLSREWERLRKMVAAIGSGALRPRNVSTSVEVFRKRERLFALVEKDRVG